jgi:hypothetical protein
MGGAFCIRRRAHGMRGEGRCAAAEEGFPDRIPSCFLPFGYIRSHRGIPAGTARAWVWKGKNIVIEWRLWDGKQDRQRALADELARLKVDVIVAVVTEIYAQPRRPTLRFLLSWLRAATRASFGLSLSLIGGSDTWDFILKAVGRVIFSLLLGRGWESGPAAPSCC